MVVASMASMASLVVASMASMASNGGFDGVDVVVDGWRRWWTGVFDTEGTDVEVPSGEDGTHSSSLFFV